MIIDCAHYRGGMRQHEGPMELDRAAEICTDGDDGFIWMGLFLAISCLFNPVIHVPLPEYIGRVVTALTILLFFFSLALLKPEPKLSIASITDPLARSQSL